MPAKPMMGNVIRNISMSFLIFQIITSAHCQPPRGPIIVSPQVNPDKTVVFRYLAPLASEVKLSGQFLKEPVIMQKDSLGIWSVTVWPHQTGYLSI